MGAGVALGIASPGAKATQDMAQPGALSLPGEQMAPALSSAA